jgi:hypothetical protein
MKKLCLLLIPFLFFTNTAFAKKDTSEESIFVVAQQNIRPIPLDDVATDCGLLQPLLFSPVAFGNRSDLFSVQSKKTNGVLLKDDIKKVGELLGCFNSGSPEIERLIIDTFDFGAVWGLELDGKIYIVTGMSRLRTDPAVDVNIGAPGDFLGVSTGTVFTPESIMMDPPVPVGSFSANYRANIYGGPTTGGILTIRLLPQD